MSKPEGGTGQVLGTHHNVQLVDKRPLTGALEFVTKACESLPSCPSRPLGPIAPDDLGELNLAHGSSCCQRGCGLNPTSPVFSSDEDRAVPCHGATKQLFTMVGAGAAQKSPTGHSSQNRGTAKSVVSAETSQEVGRWTHENWLGRTGQKDRCGGH